MIADGTAKQYYEQYWSVDEPGPLTDPFAATRLALLRDELARTSARTVFDAGCGSGDLLATLVGEGYEATGIELATAAVARAKPGLEISEHSVEDLPWPVAPASQDAVVSFEVIEHLLHPRRLLMGANEALRPGGLLWVSTPYHGRLKNLALAFGGFDRHFAVEGEHVRFFTDRALIALLHDTGFAVERIHHYGRFAPLWAGSFVMARKR